MRYLLASGMALHNNDKVNYELLLLGNGKQHIVICRFHEHHSEPKPTNFIAKGTLSGRRRREKMVVVVLGLITIVGGGAAGYYYVQKKEKEKAQSGAAGAEGEAAGGEATKKSRFSFGRKKKEGEGEAAKPSGDKKKEGFFSKMPKMPTQTDVKMMMMKQSMSGAFK